MAEVIPFPIIPRPIPGTLKGNPSRVGPLVIGQPFDPKKLFAATSFEVWTREGRFTASATLCGHIDVVIPIDGEDNTITLSEEDALAVCNVLADAVMDARKADPRDPRIVG